MARHRYARIPGFLVLTLLLTLPPAAQAQLPNADSYNYATQVNAAGQPLQGAGANRPEYADSVDTTAFGTQPDLFNPPNSGGPAERTACDPANNAYGNVTSQTSIYGKTAWWDIHPDVNGEIQVKVSGIDAVIGMLQYRAPTDAAVVDDLGCSDNPNSSSLEDVFVEVHAGAHYSIQVGGFANYAGFTPGTPQSSTNVEFYLDFYPDADLDKVYDGGTTPDRCPVNPGPAIYSGCPDGDGDTIPDIDDNCDPVQGPRKFNGCPDNDGDGVPEGEGASPRDQCPGVNPATLGRPDRDSRPGCPDHITIRTVPSYRATTRHAPRGGLVLRYFKLKDVPQGARVRVSCKPKRRCRPLNIARTKKAGTIVVKSLRGRKLRSGTQINASVTASDATPRYIRVTIAHGDSRCRQGASLRRLRRCS